MGDRSGIEWTDASWNPIVGCSIVSPGCTHCYAMHQAARIERMAHGAGRPSHYSDTTREAKRGPIWSGSIKRAPEHILTQPLRWRRRRIVFVNSMGDLFHEKIPPQWIDRVFAVMALCPQHTFQVLTKRADRMRDYMQGSLGRIADAVQPLRTDDNRVVGPLPHLEPGTPWWPLANVWLGVSAEDQARADERIPLLLDTPAAVRFVSCEPLLGPVDLTNVRLPNGDILNALTGEVHDPRTGCVVREVDALDWVIVGGESGPGARPMHPDWARSLRDQCQAAGTAFFFKQWGEWGPKDACPTAFRKDDSGIQFDVMHFQSPEGDGRNWVWKVGKRRAGRLLDGVTHDGMPGGAHA